MINVIVLIRNATHLATTCLQSLLACRDALRRGGEIEFVVIDDHSDADRGIADLLKEFRAAATDASTRLLRFHRQMHYAHGLAYGLSIARGESVLFISQDMVLAPECVEELFDCAAHDAAGIIRPTSEHMDWAKSFVQIPPTPPQSFGDVAAFSAEIRQRFRGDVTPWPMLIGDAMLIRRSVIDRIGVLDTRFYGFMADIDYGIRLHRAGFRHTIARGAWLHHEGGGTAKESGDALAKGEGLLRLVETAYAQFREKWGTENLPPHFRDMKREHFERLHALPPSVADAPVPPLPITPDIAETF